MTDIIDIVNKLRARTGRPPIVQREMTPEERVEQRAKTDKIAATLGYEGIWRKEEDTK